MGSPPVPGTGDIMFQLLKGKTSVQIMQIIILEEINTFNLGFC